MSSRTPRTLQGCRIQIYIALHFQSIPFVIDEAFLDSQRQKMNLLLLLVRCWNLWRDKHRFGLLNNRHEKREKMKKVLIFIDVGTLMLTNGGRKEKKFDHSSSLSLCKRPKSTKLIFQSPVKCCQSD